MSAVTRATERAGASTSFDAFATAALPELLRLGLLLTGDRRAAEDLAQSALERTLRAWRRIDREGNALAYTRTTMARLNIDRWRKVGRRERSWATPPEVPGRSVADPAGGVADRLQVLELLRGLPPRQRAVLVLRYYDDLSESQIADALGCSVGTVKSQAARALETLRRRDRVPSHEET